MFEGVSPPEYTIPYKEIRQTEGNESAIGLSKMISHYWKLTTPGNAMSKNHPKGSYFNEVKTHPDKVLPTIRANGLPYDYEVERTLFDDETKMAGSYPLDYDFRTNKVVYLVGMSVPPVMTAQIAKTRYRDWETDRKSTRLNSSHRSLSRMPSSA